MLLVIKIDIAWLYRSPIPIERKGDILLVLKGRGESAPDGQIPQNPQLTVLNGGGGGRGGVFVMIKRSPPPPQGFVHSWW